MRNIIILLALGLIFQSCLNREDETAEQDPTGAWRGRIMVDRESTGKELPFIFEVRKKDSNYLAYFINGTERIKTTNVQFEKDSIFITMDPYDSEIEAKIVKGQMIGDWVNYSRGRNYRMPFHARAGETQRFVINEKPKAKISGRYKVQFGEVENAEEAIAEFVQNGNLLVGTFLTETGDYRYLEGVINGETIQLSCFDGAHAFLFEGIVLDENTIVKGRFYSGSHYESSWRAFRDNKFQIRSPKFITKMKPGVDSLVFTLKEINGSIIHPKSPSILNKVTLVQIMGTWCPNCRDQTEYLKRVYKKYGEDSIAIIAVGFEPERKTALARNRLLQYKENLEIPYFVAYGGLSAKKNVHLTFPGLEPVKAYPTLIYIDRAGKVVRIHSGFAGPATSEYTNFVIDSDSLIQSLISFNNDTISADSTDLDSALMLP